MKRIVIKIGTAVIQNSAKAQAHQFSIEKDSVLGKIVRDVAQEFAQGTEIVLVSSGAIGAGMKILNQVQRPKILEQKQALAALGQVSLMENYRQLFGERGIAVAQVLMTRSDFSARDRYLNARKTLQQLLSWRVLPILNENDTVSTEEIRFGDNDNLSALVAAKMDADLLLILSDVEGLYANLERTEIIPVVPKIDASVQKLVWKKSQSALGTGGMASKIQAAKIAASSGTDLVIASAFRNGVVRDVLNGKPVGTRFLSSRKMTAREKWLLFGATPQGELVVDSGAVEAIVHKKKSLLAAGIRGCRGTFAQESVVRILNTDGQEMARGLVKFSSDQILKICGKNSADVAVILGVKSGSEVVHRNSLVVIQVS